MRLVREAHRVAAARAGPQTFGATQKTRRAAAGIPANIADGRARAGRTGPIRSLAVARGSLAELGRQPWIARDPGFLPAAPALQDGIRLPPARLIAWITSNRTSLSKDSR